MTINTWWYWLPGVVAAGWGAPAFQGPQVCRSWTLDRAELSWGQCRWLAPTPWEWAPLDAYLDSVWWLETCETVPYWWRGGSAEWLRWRTDRPWPPDPDRPDDRAHRTLNGTLTNPPPLPVKGRCVLRWRGTLMRWQPPPRRTHNVVARPTPSYPAHPAAPRPGWVFISQNTSVTLCQTAVEWASRCGPPFTVYANRFWTSLS